MLRLLKVKAVFQWNITTDGNTAGTWTVDLKNGEGSIYEGKPKKKANCTLTLSDDDLMALVAGDVSFTAMHPTDTHRLLF